MISTISPATLISEGTHVRGRLTFHSRAQLLGVIEGEIEQLSLEPLLLGKTSWTHGNIHARGPVVVEGRVEGEIFSDTKIILLPTAQVTGGLTAPVIELRAGAVFQGRTHMAVAQSQALTPLAAA